MAPSVCLHSSYRNQYPGRGPQDWGQQEHQDWGHDDWSVDGFPQGHQLEAPVAAKASVALDGSFLLAALQGGKQGVVEDQPLPAMPAQKAAAKLGEGRSDQLLTPAVDAGAATEEAPLYTFLDAGVVCQMLTREDGLFRFQGLANLCAQGHMKCSPTDGRALPKWLDPVQEHECIMFAITDMVMEQLNELAAGDPVLRLELERFRAGAPESRLQRCLEWGILEVLETTLHTQMMRLTSEHERRSKELNLSQHALKMLDFVCLWQTQIESEGRVLLLTSDASLRHFGAEVASAKPRSQWPVVLLLDELNALFQQDTARGGKLIFEASHQPGVVRQFCGAALSASILQKVAADVACGNSIAQRADGNDSVVLRQELLQAVNVVSTAMNFLRTGNFGGMQAAEAGRCLRSMEEALARWQALLRNVN
ncbi:unnamed protein product [Polarella glacialis]|uniref:Uncharacterized protein n=2 Tax=Polarella glacialis TaxID=89957 RepID=A0A813EB46_POLGL|nr:unnamed protein product [Polarella glacialis]